MHNAPCAMDSSAMDSSAMESYASSVDSSHTKDVTHARIRYH